MRERKKGIGGEKKKENMREREKGIEGRIKRKSKKGEKGIEVKKGRIERKRNGKMRKKERRE